MKRQAPTEPEARVVGWYRPDIKGRIWLFLPACILLTVFGALMVGYGYGRLERIDPIGLHSDTRAFEQGRDGETRRDAPQDRGEGDAAGPMWLFFALGLLLVASGPGVAIFFLRRLWARDDFLLLRTDALISSHEGAQERVRWDDIEAIAFVPGRGVELQMRDGGTQLVEPGLVDDGETLARRLEEVRRKATWGALPQQR